MEQEVIQLLQSTQAKDDGVRKAAEQGLLRSYTSPDLPLALLSISIRGDVVEGIRQAALLALRRVVLATWSPKFDEDFQGSVVLSDDAKDRVRHQVLAICTGDDGGQVGSRKVRSAASLVTSKIAGVDFPDSWPDLLPHLLRTLSSNSADLPVHGALRVLSDLVESGFSEEQFFAVARDLINSLQNVATHASRKPVLRAFAISVFRGCFDTLEMVMEDHKIAVKAFLEQALQGWIACFVEVLRIPLPNPPSQEEERQEEGPPGQWRGLIALKLQVIKTIVKIRRVFPTILTPHATVLFQTTWEELSRSRPAYHELFITDSREGRLEDADGLPYSLDFLVSDELDLMESLLKAPPVKAELQTQLKQASDGPQSVAWLQQIMQLAISYAQITMEEEGFWEIDVNLFLSEETAVTANYTPRIASGFLAVSGLVDWLKEVPLDALLISCRALFAESNTPWKAQEAALFLLNQVLRDFAQLDRKISPSTSEQLGKVIDQSQQSSSVLLRARTFAVAGALARTAGDHYTSKAAAYLNAATQTLATEEAPDLIRVSCIRALQDLIEALPTEITKPLQEPLISAISSYISTQDLSDSEVDDLKVSLIETLRAVITIDVSCTYRGAAIDLLFTLASHGAANFQVSLLVTETFESIVSSVANLGHEPYVLLCAKTLPPLTGAFDVGNMTEESALTNLATELVSALAQYGSEPLPEGFVATVLPKLSRILLESSDPELVRPSTLSVKHMLAHGSAQFLAWNDPLTGKSSVEVTLIIIDRLLNSSLVDDNAAAEVGGLAAELVEKAGAEKLGPFLLQLLRAVALRLATAERAQFIQSLILVFARLSISSPKDVVDFLSQVDIHGENGLNVVLAKWLENSVNFSGYDAIRQNVIALSKLYDLEDERIKQVAAKGELIVQESDRIKTRSRAKANPDQWTTIPANLKILKVLVEELTNASSHLLDPTAAAGALDSEDDEDGGDWEDVGASSTGALDLGLGMTKQELMAYDEEGSQTHSRQRDDETSDFLLGWFREQGQKARFGEMFALLNADEKETLQKLSG